MRILKLIGAALAAIVAPLAANAQAEAPAPRPDQLAFRALYQELVGTDRRPSSSSSERGKRHVDVT